MKGESIIENNKLSEITTTQIEDLLRKKGFLFPRRDNESMHVNTLRNYLRVIEKINFDVLSLRTNNGKIWYVGGKENLVLKEFFPSLEKIDSIRDLSVIRETDVDPFKMDYLFKLIENRRQLSLIDIMQTLKCTRSMASLYAKAMEKISGSIGYKNVENKKYLYKKEYERDLELIKSNEYFDSIDISNFLYNIRQFLGFSTKDFSTLLGMKLSTYSNYEKGRHTPPKDILKKINILVQEVTKRGKRKAIFESRMKRNLKEELLMLRGARLNVGLSTRELTKLLGNESDNLNNLERGFVSNSESFRKNIISILKGVARKKNISWTKILEDIEEFKKNEKQRWKNALKYDKIIDLRIPRGSGVDFENKVVDVLKEQGFFDNLISNAILSDKEYESKLEADIYAVKEFPNGFIYDVIFECKSRKERQSIGTKGIVGFARELSTIKNLLDIKEVVIVTDRRFSNEVEKHINLLGVKILYQDDLRGFFNGKRNLDRETPTGKI